jgi:molybdate transport system permease protein
VDWGCSLEVMEAIPALLTQVGIRAHQIVFLEALGDLSPNTFDCWLAGTSETPHRMTLFLKILSKPTHPSDYHLQAEVFKEKWVLLKDRPLPWRVHLDPMRLLLLE